MGLISINQVSSDPRKASTLEQIAAGVEIAANILGVGMKGYETFGPKGAADRRETNARAKLYETQAADYGGDKELDRDLKRSQIDANKAMAPFKMAQERVNLAKSSKELSNLTGPKPLQPNEIESLSEARSIPAILQNIKKLVKENPDYFGPLGGRAAGINPYDTKAQLIQSELEAAAQIIGKNLEGGVLRKEDMPKYKKMLSQMSDTPDVALGKPDQVLEKVASKYNKRIQGLRQSGYDVSQFENLIDASVPDAIAAPQKIQVSNGQELLLIDPSDLMDAEKDGYKRVR